MRLLKDGRRVRARTILIATGARPQLPPFDGIELGITSDDVFDLKTFPRKLVIGGAGYIAMEFASLFAALGSDVTVVCRGSNVLRGFDEDVRQAVAGSYTNRGIKLMFGDSIRHLERRDGDVGGSDHAGRIDVTTEQGGRLVADQVLLALGRSPNTTSLGLDRAGVKTADGAIVVDASSRTNIPNIYAVGDVSNQFNLTPVAIREGHAFADTVFGEKAWQVDYSNVPTAVFSSPEIGAVGLTELEARAQYLAVDVYKVRFRPLKAAVTGDCEASLLKVIVDCETDRISRDPLGQRDDPGASDRRRQRSHHERLHVGYGRAPDSRRGDRRNADADRALRPARRFDPARRKRRRLTPPARARKGSLGKLRSPSR